MKLSLLPAILLLPLLIATPGAGTQYPIIQQPAVIGPTPGATLRNAAAATQNQAEIVRRFASDWGRRANAANYNTALFESDYGQMQNQFIALRQQFNWLASQALQLGRPNADNAVAELDAGLTIIAELFTFLSSQYQAGTLDRRTIVRTTRAFEDAMREWQREFRKSGSRIGLAW